MYFLYPNIRAVLLSFLMWNVAYSEQRSPNIVLILADDMGYGDLSCQGDPSKVSTPNLDALARGGMRFIDAHSPSSVCTPTRYSIMTGRYCWRTELKQGVLDGYSTNLLNTGRLTVASLLKKNGYRTACIGKWHLGWNWQTHENINLTNLWNKYAKDKNIVGEIDKLIDYSQPIVNGPTSFGFDYFYGLAASSDTPPYTYVRNERVVDAPTIVIKKNSRPFWKCGAAAPGFKHQNILPKIISKSVNFISEHSMASENPFFLYIALTAPHTPVAPGEQFKDKSKAGEYGDFVVEVDSGAGQIIAALQKQGLSENTLVLFTSDNGSPFKASNQHFNYRPNGNWRGDKTDIWEGGHRVPFIAHWPKKIKPGISDETVCLSDFMATFAAITNVNLPEDAGEDSYNLLPLLLGQTYRKPLREATVYHSGRGEFAIQSKEWKLILTHHSGGRSSRNPKNKWNAEIPKYQLYNLSVDPGERNNLYHSQPEIASNLNRLLKKYQTKQRSAPMGSVK